MDLVGAKDLLSNYRDRPFREYQEEAIRYVLESDKRFVFLEAPTGCHDPNQEIMTWDGSVVRAKNVKRLDLLMGPDSLPRVVLGVVRNYDKMFTIKPIKGSPFTVSGDHVLVLKRTKQNSPHKRKRKDCMDGKVVEVTVNEWMSWTKSKKHIHKIYRVPVKFFESTARSFLVPPYLLGLLLGDGMLSNTIGISSGDNQIVDYINRIAEKNSLKVRRSDHNKFDYYFSAQTRGKKNNLLCAIRSLGLFGKTSSNKFVPHEYKTSGWNERLEILAGIIDTDGSCSNGTYDVISKSKVLANDICFIARSVGLAAYIKKCIKGCQGGFTGTYYRVSISGDCDMIPCKIPRKVAPKRKQKKDVLVTGFEIMPAGGGDYVGFRVSGDQRYLLGDFTVTHNSGKSLIAMVAGQAMGGVTYAVHSKILQHQITSDFPEAVSLFGRGNYPCKINGDVTCDECFHTKQTPCYSKSSCLYEVQKKCVLSSKLRILNYDYLLSEANYVGRFSDQSCVIVDEADNLENTLINFVTLTFTTYALGRLGLHDEIEKLKKSSKNQDVLIESWKGFCKEAGYRTAAIIDKMDAAIETFRSPLSEWQTKQIKERNRVFRLQEKIGLFLENADASWLYDDSQADRYTFRPLWLTEQLSEQFLWRHSLKWVFMSASFLPMRLEAKRLGIPFGELDYHLVPSTFPVERRPIHINPVANLTGKTMEAETPKLVAEIKNILSTHPDEKGLIHAVSYKLAGAIADGLNSDRVVIHDSKDRQEALDRFMNSGDPLVLISPSMERGVSLEMDLCRFIIVAKAPFLYLGDKIVAARVYSSKLGNEWYAATMLSTVLQMTGRGMRSADDTCVSYILDEQFQRVFNKRPLFLPPWWRDAVSW